LYVNLYRYSILYILCNKLFKNKSIFWYNYIIFRISFILRYRFYKPQITKKIIILIKNSFYLHFRVITSIDKILLYIFSCLFAVTTKTRFELCCNNHKIYKLFRYKGYLLSNISQYNILSNCTITNLKRFFDLIRNKLRDKLLLKLLLKFINIGLLNFTTLQFLGTNLTVFIKGTPLLLFNYSAYNLYLQTLDIFINSIKIYSYANFYTKNILKSYNIFFRYVIKKGFYFSPNKTFIINQGILAYYSNFKSYSRSYIFYFRIFDKFFIGYSGMIWEYNFIQKLLFLFLKKFLHLILQVVVLKIKNKNYKTVMIFNSYLKWPLFFWKVKYSQSSKPRFYPALFFILQAYLYRGYFCWCKIGCVFKPLVYFKFIKLSLDTIINLFNIIIKEFLNYFCFCNKRLLIWYIIILLKKSFFLTIYNLHKKLIIKRLDSSLANLFEHKIVLELFYPKAYNISIFFYNKAKDFFLSYI
jgi:hypothetical protein